MKQQRRRRLLASLGAVVTGGALAIGSGVAMADASPSTINPDAEGSINITKYETPAGGTGAEATGALDEDQTGTPVKGVKYEACRVNPAKVDLLTNEGWQAATKVTAEMVAEGSDETKLEVKLGDDVVTCTELSATQSTDQDGKASFANLNRGLYVVREVSAPDNVQANPTPFLVTVPMTDPEDRDAWMYDIYVYPKDAALTDATKTVDDVAALAPGKEIKWTVETKVPYVPNQSESGKAPVTALTVTDTLPEGVELADPVPTVTVSLTGTTLTVDDDYTVTWNDSKLTVDLAKYLDTVANQTSIQGETLTVTITAKISDAVEVDAGSSKDLKNTATVNVNGDEMELKTNEVTSTYASASFTKIAHKKGEETDVPLKDAKFAVYATRASAMDAETTGQLVTSVATSADGVVTLKGLRASSVSKNDPSQPQGLYKDGECSLNPAYQVYWLVETTAPDGYELLAAPIPVVLEKSGDNYVFKQATETAAGSGVLGLTKDSGDDATTCSLTLTNLDKVENVPHNAGFDLPLTGGTGTLLLIVVGAGLLLFVLVMARRRGSVE